MVPGRLWGRESERGGNGGGNEKGVVDGLNGLLADATVFYQKLRHYHWNVDTLRSLLDAARLVEDGTPPPAMVDAVVADLEGCMRRRVR
jgi:hypothetical protein